MKKLNYDYSKLDEYLDEYCVFHEGCSENIMEVWAAYSSMITYLANKVARGDGPMPFVGEDTADFFQFYVGLFNILENLPEVSNDPPDPARVQEKDIPSMSKKYDVKEDELQNMIRQKRMHRAFIELEKDMDDHLVNLIEIFMGYTNGKPRKKPSRKIPVLESFNLIHNYLTSWKQYRDKLRPEE